MSKTRRAGQQRGPGITGRIDSAGDEERQLREEYAVLIGHVVADDLLPGDRHAFGDAQAALQRDFASVPGRGHFRRNLASHRTRLSAVPRGRQGQPRGLGVQAAADRPTGVLTKGTKPGSASMRFSQPCTDG